MGVNKLFRWTEDKPYGGEQNKCLLATVKYGEDDIKEDVMEDAPFRLLVMDGDNTELPPVVCDNDELVNPPSDRGYNDVKGKPPDECAKNYVYRGGSPLSIVGVVTCNVPNGLGIKIFYWWISFWMRFDGLDWHGVPFLPVSLDLLTVTLSVSRPGGVWDIRVL